MQKYDFTAPASGASQTVNAPGRYVKYVSGNAGGNDTGLIITPGSKPGSKILLYPGQAFTLPDSVAQPNGWTIANAVGQANISGSLVIGEGRLDDNTLQGVVQVMDGGKSRTLAGGAFMANMYEGPVASQYPAIQLWNAAGTGKRLVVESMALNATIAGAAQWFIDQTILANLNAGGAQNKLSGGPAPASQVRSETSVTPYGGNLLGSAFLASNTLITFSLKEPIVILPGYGLKFGQQTQNSALQAVVEFYEEPNV